VIQRIELLKDLIHNDIAILVNEEEHTPKVGEIIDIDPATKRISIVWIDEGEPWDMPESEVESRKIRFFRKILSQLDD
jgi:hypothetical protein